MALNYHSFLYQVHCLSVLPPDLPGDLVTPWRGIFCPVVGTLPYTSDVFPGSFKDFQLCLGQVSLLSSWFLSLYTENTKGWKSRRCETLNSRVIHGTMC